MRKILAAAALAAFAVRVSAGGAAVIDTGFSPDAAYRMDAAMITFDNGYVLPAYRGVGQTFIAPAADFTMGLRFMSLSPKDASFRYMLYEGAGQGGRLLSDQLMNASLGEWNNPTLVERNFSNLGIRPGATYTLWAVNKDVRYPINTSRESGILMALSGGANVGADSYAGGRMVVDNWDPQAPQVDLSFKLSSAGTAAVNHGVFIGARDPNGLQTYRGDASAELVKAAFDTRPNTASYLLTGDLTRNADGSHLDPITNAEVGDLLRSVRERMGPNDSLTLYITGHGNSEFNESWLEKVFSGRGDEYLRLGERLHDNTLADELALFGGRRITTFLDGCHTGGFWGNADAEDIESRGKTDLDGVSNIALFTAAAENRVTYMDASGLGVYSRALSDAMRDHPELSGSELNDWLGDRAYHYTTSVLGLPSNRFFEMEMGEEVTPGADMFHLGAQFAPDFDQAASFAGTAAAPVPEPSPTHLLVLGLGWIAAAHGWRARRPIPTPSRA